MLATHSSDCDRKSYQFNPQALRIIRSSPPSLPRGDWEGLFCSHRKLNWYQRNTEACENSTANSDKQGDRTPCFNILEGPRSRRGTDRYHGALQRTLYQAVSQAMLLTSSDPCYRRVFLLTVQGLGSTQERRHPCLFSGCEIWLSSECGKGRVSDVYFCFIFNNLSAADSTTRNPKLSVSMIARSLKRRLCLSEMPQALCIGGYVEL